MRVLVPKIPDHAWVQNLQRCSYKCSCWGLVASRQNSRGREQDLPAWLARSPDYFMHQMSENHRPWGRPLPSAWVWEPPSHRLLTCPHTTCNPSAHRKSIGTTLCLYPECMASTLTTSPVPPWFKPRPAPAWTRAVAPHGSPCLLSHVPPPPSLNTGHVPSKLPSGLLSSSA